MTIPAGWRLVPEDADWRMYQAWAERSELTGKGIVFRGNFGNWQHNYHCMLAAAPSPPSGWLGIESAPKDGDYLAYLAEPMLGSRFAVVKAHPNVSLVGGAFLFDAPNQIGWMPLPPPPEDRT